MSNTRAKMGRRSSSCGYGSYSRTWKLGQEVMLVWLVASFILSMAIMLVEGGGGSAGGSNGWSGDGTGGGEYGYVGGGTGDNNISGGHVNVKGNNASHGGVGGVGLGLLITIVVLVVFVLFCVCCIFLRKTK